MILLSIVVKVTLTTTLTLIAVRIAAKSRAAVRHLALKSGSPCSSRPLASLMAPAFAEMPIGPPKFASAPRRCQAAEITATTITADGSCVAAEWLADRLTACAHAVDLVARCSRCCPSWSDCGKCGSSWHGRVAGRSAIAAAIASRSATDRSPCCCTRPLKSVTFGVRRPRSVSGDGRGLNRLARAISHEPHVRRNDWLINASPPDLCDLLVHPPCG